MMFESNTALRSFSISTLKIHVEATAPMVRTFAFAGACYCTTIDDLPRRPVITMTIISEEELPENDPMGS
jgi:hypothetical protein